MLLVLLACAEPPASKPTAPPAGARPPAATTPAAAPAPQATPAAPAGFEAKAFACCDTPEALGILGSYLGVQKALAADNEPAAQAASLALATGADKLLPSAAEADRAPLTAVATGARASAARPIAELRSGFKAVSTAVLTYTRAHPGGDMKVAPAYCPMADASWLQTEATVSNPYYGAEMLTCGYFK